MMFPTCEQALEIALMHIPVNSKIVCVTDNKNELTNLYGVDPGCWYIVYCLTPDQGRLQSSLYIAISKVDGRVISQGDLQDEG